MVCFWILHIYWNTLFSLPRPQSQISDFGTSKVSYWSRACPVKHNMTLSEQRASLVRIRLQCRRPGFDPWIGKIPWRRERLPIPVFWPRKFHGLYPWGCKELDTTEQLSLSFHWNSDWIIQAIHTLPSEGAKGEKEDKEKKGATEVGMVDYITNSMDMSLSKLQEMVKDREASLDTVHGITKSWTQLS